MHLLDNKVFYSSLMHGTNIKIIFASVLMFRIFTEDKGRIYNDTNKYQLNEDAVKNSYTLQVA